ncbi:Hypothetical protein CINCED_3A008368 [Cinara cedri]|uniref:Uncharacterized protein n=1 Tax=Cinara cedri TaxID=506608 RepID=A0A5E4N1B6_9HEMI|nr:Hypothetical protein CINCED_3A008368 [Cinara cedri]
MRSPEASYYKLIKTEQNPYEPCGKRPLGRTGTECCYVQDYILRRFQLEMKNKRIGKGHWGLGVRRDVGPIGGLKTGDE